MSEPLRVLVIDDCRDTAESTAMVLDAWGMKASVAFDGRSALAHAKDHVPDIVLLDIGLADISGLEVAASLRKSKRFRRTMIVAVSGYVAESDRDSALAAGCQYFIIKPVELIVLRGLLLEGLKEFRRNDPASTCPSRE